MSVTSRLAARRLTVRPGALGRRRSLAGFAYALPTLVFVVVFFILPLLLVGQMSASDWKLLGGDKGINFPTNYGALNNNPLFWPAVEFTIRYTVIVTVLLIGLGLGLALIVQESSRWVGMLRTVFLIPLAVGLAAASLLFWGFYSDSIGPVNPLLQQVGLIDDPILFFATHTNAFLSTVFMIVWKFVGLYMLILLVGLQAIPTELYEAASIDGGGRHADLPAHHAAAAAPVTRAGTDPVRDRVAAGVRPLLSPHQGRPGQLHGHHRAAHLSAGVRAPEPRYRRRPLAGPAGRAPDPQHDLVPPPSTRDGSGMSDR